MNDSQTTPPPTKPTPANRLGWDYRKMASDLGDPVVPIIDCHAHINGIDAVHVYDEARRAFGVTETWSMTRLTDAERIHKALDGRINFIAVPNYMSDDPKTAQTQGFLDDIPRWGELGAKLCKFWCAPRGRDYSEDFGEENLCSLNHPWRKRQMERAAENGMCMMAHIADPDTWFRTNYKDAERYGTKAEQYDQLAEAIEAYPNPWLIAHMGGSPEDLGFLTELLLKYPTIYLDTSACKWMVRELSLHPSEELIGFFDKFKGRILFGSDIVSMDAHLSPQTEGRNDRVLQAGSREEAFDLYASRYWALRTLFETDYSGESPIADPDLKLINPEKYDDMSAPQLRGHALPKHLLKSMYRDAPEAFMQAVEAASI